MKHLFICGGMSCLSLLVAAQQKDLFDLQRHLEADRPFSRSLNKNILLPLKSAQPYRMQLAYHLPDGNSVYNLPAYRMPVIVPQERTDQIPNLTFTQPRFKRVMGWPGLHLAEAGTMPNPSPKISW